ncbi:hypothetical protein [Mycobacterium sp.]|uniref:hypothetical protein n=1 Tax=Mycobacterium sp. TaxID=1785 RepID=UPI003F97C690
MDTKCWPAGADGWAVGDESKAAVEEAISSGSGSSALVPRAGSPYREFARHWSSNFGLADPAVIALESVLTRGLALHSAPLPATDFAKAHQAMEPMFAAYAIVNVPSSVTAHEARGTGQWFIYGGGSAHARVLSALGLVRNGPLEVVEPALSKRIVQALEESLTDFRTVSSLADQLGVSDEMVRQELERLGEAVRRPLGQERSYPDWYRLKAKGPTRQERLARLKAVLGFSAMDDDF